jgi:hypothetical protein
VNRPIGFDATIDHPRPASYAGPQSTPERITIAAAWAAHQNRKRAIPSALVDALKVAGGALGCIGFVAYVAVVLAM